MTLCVVGVLASLAAVVAGLLTSNAPLLVLGFMGFGTALGCADHISDSEYAHHSDSLTHLDQMRIGLARIHEDDAA